MFFTAIAAIIGISAAIGSITGMFTGEGILQGAIQGANIVGNAMSSVVELSQGNFTDAALHILGVSSQVIEDIHSGEFPERRPSGPGLERIAGGYDYRDIDAHNQSLGIDALSAAATIIGAGVLSHYSTQIGAALGKGTVPFIIGSQIGSFQGKMTQLVDVFEDLVEEIPDFNVGGTLVPAITVTGSPNRWDTGEGIIPGEVFEEEEEETRY